MTITADCDGWSLLGYDSTVTVGVYDHYCWSLPGYDSTVTVRVYDHYH